MNDLPSLKDEIAALKSALYQIADNTQDADAAALQRIARDALDKNIAPYLPKSLNSKPVALCAGSHLNDDGVLNGW